MLTILFNRLNRIQMKVSLSQTLTDTQTVFPLYIFLARLVSDVGAAEVVIVPFKQNCFCALLPTGFIGCNTSTLIFFFYLLHNRKYELFQNKKYSAIYSISRLCMFRKCPGINGSSQVQANFTLPEVSKLAVEAKSRTLAILFISSGMHMLSVI